MFTFDRDSGDGIEASGGEADPKIDPQQSVADRNRMLIVLGVVAVLAGLFLRIWLLGREPINSDEAVVGLMAREILHGHLFAFYWGQHYGGGEPYLVAAVFWIFGQSAFTLGVTPILLDGCAAVLIWRIGRRLLSPRAGVGAALLFWIWPEVYLWQSTIEYGFRWLALDCGLAALLAALRISGASSQVSSRRSAMDWVIFGGALGVGWWATPEIVYYVVPSVFLVASALITRRDRRDLPRIAFAVGAAVIGALPWLYDNVGKGFVSLHSAPQPDPGFGVHLRVLVVHVIPMLLGLRLRTSGDWIVAATLAKVLYGVLALVFAAALIAIVRRTRAYVFVVFAVAAPILYAVSPFTWYWADGRYAIYLAPFFALVVAGGLDELARVVVRANVSRRVASLLAPGYLQLVGVALGVALTLGAAYELAPYRPRAGLGAERSWTSYATDPTGYLQPTVLDLRRDGIADVYAGYWVAYTLSFEARGTLTASDVTFARYPPALVAIERSAAPAWLFAAPNHLGELEAVTGSSLLNPGCIGGLHCLTRAALEHYLNARSDRFTVVPVGDFVAITPEHPVSPIAVMTAAGVMG